MATYYVDPAAVGLDNGTSWANAWTTFQKAIDGTGGTQPTAGDTVYMRGTETLAATIDLDGLSGTELGGRISYVGVNASGVEDGSYYVIDVAGAARHGLNILTSDLINIRNVEIKNTAANYDGVTAPSYQYANFNLYENLYIHDCGRDGWGAGHYSQYASLYRCRFVNNGRYGLHRCAAAFYYCSFSNNVSSGVENFANLPICQSTYIGCIFRGNGGPGLRLAGYGSGEHTSLINCIIVDNTSDGLRAGVSPTLINLIGCRITGNATAIKVEAAGGCLVNLFGCYIPDTGQDEANTTKFSMNNSLQPHMLGINGVDTNIISGTDTNGGYVNPGAGDFSLANAASLRAFEIDIDGTHSQYLSAGLTPNLSSFAGKHPLARF